MKDEPEVIHDDLLSLDTDNRSSKMCRPAIPTSDDGGRMRVNIVLEVFELDDCTACCDGSGEMCGER